MSERNRWSWVALVIGIAGCSPSFALANEVKIGDGLTGMMADEVALDTALGTPYVVAGESTKAFLKVGLTGSELAAGEERAPLNIALVLDKSSSMSGRKLSEAKRAAALAISRLGPEDIVSVISYDSVVRIIVPATPVTDPDAIIAAVSQLQPSGSTALFGGVSRGAAELRRFLDPDRVNRVILLSDGMANVGPSSPGELAALGRSLAAEGISVTTIGLGLGYNEDLMAQLARASDGNHSFVEKPGDLARLFEYELGDLLSVVAQDLRINIACNKGVRPLRVLGHDALIDGQNVQTTLSQIYAQQKRFVLLEVELSPVAAGRATQLAAVTVDYAGRRAPTRATLRQTVAVHGTRSHKMVNDRINADVMVAATELLTNERNAVAIALRDEGKAVEARRVIDETNELLDNEAKKYRSPRLRRLQKKNVEFSDQMLEGDWNATRKQMYEQDVQLGTQATH